MVIAVLLMGLGGGVTYWIQLNRLQTEWSSWVPMHPAGIEIPAEVDAWESQIREGDAPALAAVAEWYRSKNHDSASLAAYETLTRIDPQNG